MMARQIAARGRLCGEGLPGVLYPCASGAL